jgi:protein TonB
MAEPLADPPRLVRRRADRAIGLQSRDRLTTMLVLAALLHGLIILGISFTAPGSRDDGSARGLEVLLVSDELPEARQNDAATYLSQRTQLGSGNTRDRLAARLPATVMPAQDNLPASRPESVQTEEQVLATSAFGSRTHVQVLPIPGAAELAAAEQSEARRRGDDELRLRGMQRDELYITADTRASRLAPYLDGWRRRVERVGTVNYPSAAQRQGLSGNPVIEVTLQRDGRLRAARIQHSSGHPEIDAAALDILRLSSPFDPFPPELARDYQTLRFAYEWQFVGGNLAQTAISVP